MGPVALDASVAIGFLDPADAHHQRATEALRECREASLSMVASAYGETLVKPLANGYGDVVDEFVNSLGVEIIPIDRLLARRVAAIRAEHPTLLLPDAAVFAAAQLRGARLLTFDERLRQL